MSLEYLGLSAINGPLVVLEGVKNASFDEIVKITVDDNIDTIQLNYNKLLRKAQAEGKYEVVLRVLDKIKQLKAIENEVISYMTENGLDTEITDTAKITYKPQSRTTLDKEKLSEILGEDLKPFEKTTSFKVLRIN